MINNKALKEELKSVLDKHLNGELFSKQLDVLCDIEDTFFEDYRKEKLKNLEYCDKCHEYYAKNQWKEIQRKETHNECTFTDAGYGDDNLFGDVTALYIYKICPMCKKEKYKDRLVLKIENEKRRY